MQAWWLGNFDMRILLISYHFPPYNNVGAVRPGKFAKYLHQHGHTVHVISAQNPPFVQGLPLEIPAEQVHRACGWSINAPVYWLLGGRKKVVEGYAHQGKPWLRHLGKWYRMLLHWPDAEAGWVNGAVRMGRRLLAEHGFDLIYATAPSYSALMVGTKLAKESGLPWVAEFRDLWSDNAAYLRPAWRRFIERLWEKQVLRTAAALVTISPPLVTQLRRFGKPVWEVRNGFDPDDLLNVPVTASSSQRLDIAFTGSLYPEQQDVDVFCDGLAEFRASGGIAHLHVVGRNVTSLLEAAEKSKISDWVTMEPTVERTRALSLQRSADVLLLFLWNDGSAGIYTTKLFEYAGAGRPILAVGPKGTDVGTWIEDANIGAVASRADDVAAQLLAWQRLKISSGGLNVTPKSGYDFTRTTQFSRLEALLQLLLAPSGKD
jgi:glycosyltransferase involved in cell wall biosynthesis